MTSVLRLFLDTGAQRRYRDQEKSWWQAKVLQTGMRNHL